MDNVTLIRIVSGMLALFVFAGFIVVTIFFILTLSRALNKCSAAARTIQPGMLWLLLIPLVNLVWNFIVVLGMAKSLGNEFRARGSHDVEREPGKTIGIAMAICGVCAVIPIVGIVAGLASLVLWILYWVKMAEFSRKLDVSPATVGMPLTQGLWARRREQQTSGAKASFLINTKSARVNSCPSRCARGPHAFV